MARPSNRTERRAELAEREVIKIKLLTHLETRVGEAFHALIIGVEDYGLFAQLVELPIEGLVHVRTLGDDFYTKEAETHSLIGRRSGRRFRLGDRMEVRVARVDVDRRELDLVPIDRDRDAPPPPPRPRSRSPVVSAPRGGKRVAPKKPKLKGKPKRKR